MYIFAMVDEEKCTGCRMCIQICPEPNAIKFIADMKKAVIISSRCKGCGLCEVVCPDKANAIAMKQAVLS